MEKLRKNIDIVVKGFVIVTIIGLAISGSAAGALVALFICSL